MWSRWVQGPDAVAPGVGADSERGLGLSVRRAGGEKRAAVPWWQQRRRRVDAVGDTRPEEGSGLGSSVEPAGSKEETRKITAIKLFSLRRKLT